MDKFGYVLFVISPRVPDDMESKREPDGDLEWSITARLHDTSWSVTLVTPSYNDEPALVVKDAISAIEQTASRNHVNVVTHSPHGHPPESLSERLDEAFDDVSWE